MFSLDLDTKQVDKNIDTLAKKSPVAFEKGLQIASIQFLTWCNNGSPRESRKPPIRRGFLRGSSTAFVSGKMVAEGPGNHKDANSSFSQGKGEAAWGWNSEYATKMHEENYNPGPYSQQDGDAGNKWLEKHLKADREAWLALVAVEVKKELKT